MHAPKRGEPLPINQALNRNIGDESVDDPISPFCRLDLAADGCAHSPVEIDQLGIDRLERPLAGGSNQPNDLGERRFVLFRCSEIRRLGSSMTRFVSRTHDSQLPCGTAGSASQGKIASTVVGGGLLPRCERVASYATLLRWDESAAKHQTRFRRRTPFCTQSID
jgi:hypothetical protein